ncbi:MAG: ABC transporter permease [Ginsengibacter sp.]
MFKNYFKIAWRNLVKDKTHSFINVAGLSIGMMVAILISLWMYDELSYNKNFKNYDRIAQVIQNVTNNGEVQTWRSVPYPLSQELRKNYGSDFKDIAMAVDWNDSHVVTIGDKKLKETGGFFEKEMPEMFSLNMLKGKQNGLSDPSSILVSASAAKAYFGKEDPINKMIKIDQMQPLKISGVYEDFPENSALANLSFIASWDFWYSSNNQLKDMEDPWRPNFASMFVQINENADFDKVSERIKDAKLKKVNGQLQKKKPAVFLQPMSKWHLYSEFKEGKNTGGAIKYVNMVAIIGVFVLLLACINFMNLSTARSERRAKEVGIRKTIGSLRRQLILQFFSESLLTVILAFILSLLLAMLSLSFFNEVSNKHLSILWRNSFFWMASFAFIIVTALIAGSYPAFYLSSFRPVKVLKGTFKAGRYAALPRKVLVVLQFTVSVALIIGTMVVYRQIQFAKDRPVGYSRANLVSIPIMDSSIHNHFNAIRDDLLQTGTITSIAESNGSTTYIGSSSSTFNWRGKDPNLSIDFGAVGVSYDYGKTTDWQIKDGRDFSIDFATDSSGMILNEAAALFMGLKHPVGETITGWNKHFTVVGVIDDMVMESPYNETRPVIYISTADQGNVILLKINSTVSTKNAINKIEAVFKKFNPGQPFEYTFVDDEYAKKFGDEERIGKLAGFFTVLAVVISCLGLFGLTSFVAEQRKKEIGVRKVLGASVVSVWNLLSKDFVLLVFTSLLFAIPLSYYFMHEWLQSYTYRTQMSWWIFAAAGAGALVITFLTVSFQAIKAAIANPVKSLRTE